MRANAAAGWLAARCTRGSTDDAECRPARAGRGSGPAGPLTSDGERVGRPRNVVAGYQVDGPPGARTATAGTASLCFPELRVGALRVRIVTS